MRGRHYVEQLTVGDEDLQSSSDNPNGVNVGTRGSISMDGTAGEAYINQDGDTAWAKIERESVGNILGLPFVPGAIPFITSLATKVFSLAPAPADLTLKQLLVTSLRGAAEDATAGLVITSITINGGANLVDGEVLTAIFSGNAPSGASPEWNLPVNSGEVVAITIENLTTLTCTMSIGWTYQLGLSGASPIRMVGLPGLLTVTDGATASGTFTVVTAPLAAGDTVDIASTFLGTFSLVGVAGARTPGSDDFDATIGTTNAMAVEIAAAINDAANSWDDDYIAAPVGPVVTVTRVQGGAQGNEDALSATTVPPGGVTTVGMTGGLYGTGTATFATSADERRASRIYTYSILSANGIQIQGATTITDLEVGGAPPVPVVVTGGIPAEQLAMVQNNQILPVDIAIPAATALSLEVANSAGLDIAFGAAYVANDV